MTTTSMGAVDLSVIIASYNTKDLLRDCLRSIYDTTKEISFEVIVVDDCSTDGSVEMVNELFPETRVIRNTTNLRYAK
ncbi:MAG: glycosyltransferase, partial [Gemmatimonadota bacterium]|nr:glycosyltransferase [Gemmatimonadota bacterium]